MLKMMRTEGWRRVAGRSAALLLLGALAGGVAWSAEPPAIKEAQPLLATKPEAAVKVLKAALSKAGDAADQSALRLALIDAYVAHGRPIDAAAEAATWLRANPNAANREKVVLTLIACQKQSNEWAEAAGTSRTFVRDFPRSAEREAVLVGLVDIARYGQQSLSSEASALGEYVSLLPGAKDLDLRMLRLARVQEQIGDLNGAVATIEKFVQKFGQDEHANDLGWRAVWLLHDRLRKTAEAVAWAQNHLKKYPKRATVSRDWQYVGDLCRSIDKPADAIAAYRNALSVDAGNRDAGAALIDTVLRGGTLSDARDTLTVIEKNFPKHKLALDARLVVLRKQLVEPKPDGQATFAAASKLLEEGHRTAEVCQLVELSAAAWGQATSSDKLPAVVELYQKQIAAFKTGLARTDVAVRLAAVLRGQGKLAESLAVLAAELKENPANRRELTKDYLFGVIDAQTAEVNARKRTRFELDATFRELAELVRPHSYMPELRAGMDEAAAPLNRLKLKDATNALRQEIEKLAGVPAAVAVDTAIRESRRDAQKVLDALKVLLPEAKDKPYLFEIVAESVWWAFDRLKEDFKEKLLPWLGAWADARPQDLGLNREVGEAYRRFNKNTEAMKYLTRVVDAPASRDTGFQIGLALGSVLDLQAYTLKQAGAVEALAAKLEKVAEMLPPSLLQERYRQFAEVWSRQKDGKEKQLDYYRKAVSLGLVEQSLESARGLLTLLPSDQAVKLGKELLANAANDRFAGEIGLLTAQRMAIGQKDLIGAVELLRAAQLRRELATTAQLDDPTILRDLIRLAQDASDAKRVADASRKALLEGMKPLSPEQMDGLLETAMRWLGSQQLHDVAAEGIARAGAAKAYARQLVVYSTVLARVRPNDAWHWDRNLAIVRQEVSRQNLGTASTMLRLLMKANPQYSEDARQIARNLLIQTYAKFGEDLLAVPDEKGPIAALIKGANYLRLGEERQAWEIYATNSKLFADKIDEVPSEYVLFVGDTLARNSDADRDVAEQLLRTWLARVEKQPAVEATVKAAVSLKLADVFFWGRRYDVARAEYQSVIDKFADSKEATDAQFRIGESLMYQKNYPEAQKVFEKLRKSTDAETSIRGTFMTGVLQYTQGSRDEARETFKTLLDLSPSEEVASKTLYQLALIYGDDKRFKEMLDMLQAIGSFGSGKRWHTPGQTLTVMIHDPDLAIVQEASTVPVVVRTSTGDRETVNMIGGAAGRGIFMASLQTALGSPRIGDGTLQLLGNDVITYDYPDDFKKKFKYIPPPQGNIRIAADGQFWASSTKIEDEEKTSVVERAVDTAKIKRASVQSAARSGGSFRPGNPLYFRVIDPDRSTTTGVDRVEINLSAASGDNVRAYLAETGPDTGIFEGQVATAERPPEAVASDSALSRPAALAADKDPSTAWESQHDGLMGKWITADVKDVYPIRQFKFTVPNPKANCPTKWMLWSSINGQMWEAVYSTEKDRIAHGLALTYGPFRHNRWAWSKVKGAVGAAAAPKVLWDYTALLKGGKLPAPDSKPMASLALTDHEPDAEADVHVITGYFPVSGTGKITLFLRGGKQGAGALVIDGRVVADKIEDFGQNGLSLELQPGWHRIAAFLTTRPQAAARKPDEALGLAYMTATGGGGGRGAALNVPLQTIPSTTGGRDASIPAPAAWTVPDEPKVTPDNAGGFAVELPSLPARMLKLDILAYQGDFVSISGITVSGEDPSKPYLPTNVDLLSLADDDILQVSPGDAVTASYADQINLKTPGSPRLLSSKLQATYFNATVNAITYEVQTGGAGAVSRTVKELYRIDPGDRIVASISDPDEDTTEKPDKITFRIRTETGEELKDLEAQETGDTTGVFTREIDTTDKPAAGKLLIKPGEKVYLIYMDKLNTNPGSRTERTAQIEVVKPTDGAVAILPTRVEVPPPPKAGSNGSVTISAKDLQPTIIYLEPQPGKPARVVLAAPLTIAVTDEDCAKDSHSTVQVQITTSAGAKMTLPLEISDQARPAAAGGKAPARALKADGTVMTAVDEGRFVGQALLMLGRPDAEGKAVGENLPIEKARGLLGAWKYQADAAGNVAAPILPISGQDTITVTYLDKRNTGTKEETRKAEGRMVTDATLANLDRGYEKAVSLLHLGEKMYIMLNDGDRDATSEQDVIMLDLTTKSGVSMQVKLTETLGHSGVFTGEVVLQHFKQATSAPATGPATSAATAPAGEASADAATQPTTRPLVPQQVLKTTFGDVITMRYSDESNTMGPSPVIHEVVVNVAVGADASMLAFTKQFGSEEIAVETQFKLAECYFELFKSHNSLNQTVELKQALEAGRGILADLRDNYRGSTYEARVLYLLGSFHQELKEFDEGIECFRAITRVYPNSVIAPEAQYKLGQCFEDRREMDLACEEYVRLAYTYPESPLIAKCMVRLSDYFYKSAKYVVAANVCGQFLEQYAEHEWAPKIAFREGQCYFKDGEAQTAALEADGGAKGGSKGSSKGGVATGPAASYVKAAKAFDFLIDRYADADVELRSSAMFWSGQSYHKAGDFAAAYRKYRRCTWDYPDTDAARYARGQLTLPEIAQAEAADMKASGGGKK